MNAEPGRAVLAPATEASGWSGPLLLLAAVLAALGLAFAEEAASAVRVWDSSTAYNHCWLVLPIALWLAWSRRFRLAGLRPAPAPLLALLGIPVALAWLAAERLGIMEGRQLAALALLEVAVLVVLGWRVFAAFAVPLLYLVFLVPFGAFLVPWLQQVTAVMIEAGLTLAGVPHYIDDLLIQIPAGDFLVAEACAGLRFLIAALAFGALYAAVMFRSPGRRIIVMLLALVVPIIANGIRALGIVLFGHWLGSAEAAAADHLIYGWAFFSAVILLLTLAGLPFREDHDGLAPLPAWAPAPPAGPRALAMAAAAALAVGIVAPGIALALQRSAPALILPQKLAPLAGCTATPDGFGMACAGASIGARLVAFPAGTTWGSVVAASQRAFASTDDDLTFTVEAADGRRWRGRQSRGSAGTVATAIWVDGRPAGGGLRSRLDQALRSLGFGSGAPVLAIVAATPAADLPAGASPDRALLLRVMEAEGAGLAAAAATRSASR